MGVRGVIIGGSGFGIMKLGIAIYTTRGSLLKLRTPSSSPIFIMLLSEFAFISLFVFCKEVFDPFASYNISVSENLKGGYLLSLIYRRTYSSLM